MGLKVVWGCLLVLAFLIGCTTPNETAIQTETDTRADLLVFDCGEEWACFVDKLLFCERAKVKLPPEEVIGKDITQEYYATDNTLVEVDKWDNVVGRCVVNFSSLRYKSRIVENKDGAWGKTRCYYVTNAPRSDEKKVSSPWIANCVELRGE